MYTPWKNIAGNKRNWVVWCCCKVWWRVGVCLFLLLFFFSGKIELHWFECWYQLDSGGVQAERVGAGRRQSKISTRESAVFDTLSSHDCARVCQWTGEVGPTHGTGENRLVLSIMRRIPSLVQGLLANPGLTSKFWKIFRKLLLVKHVIWMLVEFLTKPSTYFWPSTVFDYHVPTMSFMFHRAIVNRCSSSTPPIWCVLFLPPEDSDGEHPYVNPKSFVGDSQVTKKYLLNVILYSFHSFSCDRPSVLCGVGIYGASSCAPAHYTGKVTLNDPYGREVFSKEVSFTSEGSSNSSPFVHRLFLDKRITISTSHYYNVFCSLSVSPQLLYVLINCMF